MYLNNHVTFRCPKEIYKKLRRAIKGNKDIENTSHAIRIAVIKYTTELENAKDKRIVIVNEGEIVDTKWGNTKLQLEVQMDTETKT